MSRNAIETSPFFSRMEEFGFFEIAEEHLPDDFTLIYDIARILENAQHVIARGIAPILQLNASSDNNRSAERVVIPNIPDAEEYEADLIRSVTDVRHIYPYQHLLPEPVFLQRLADRSLWMPRARVPRNYRYQTESDQFAPDDRKQKVYILFDTSKSMQQQFRIHLAKAIAYLFLHNNRRELGTVFFRTFDIGVGELSIARDLPSFDRMISMLMHTNAHGNGTSLQKALKTAIEDIQHESQISQAQILVITDGVAHIDLEELRLGMGDSITVNTVKIGHTRMVVDAKIIEDQIYHSTSEDAIRLRQLYAQRRDIELQLSTASGHMRQEGLHSQSALIQRQIDTLTDRMGVHISEHYGLEIEQLSTVYVNIDDIDPSDMFSLSEETVVRLENLTSALVAVLRDEHQVEDMKRAAVLYDHLLLLMEYNTVDAARFKKAAEDLEAMLQSILNQPSTDPSAVSISELERVQLRHMLSGSMSSTRFSFARVILMLWRKLLRWWRTGRQLRMFQSMTGKRIKRRGP